MITSEILIAYSQCPRKAFLLLCTNQKGIQHEYITILDQRKQSYQHQYINALKQKAVDVQSYTTDALKNGTDFLVDAILQTEGLEAACGLLTRMEGRSAFGNYHYEPTIFVGTHKIGADQKLEAVFVGHVLGRIQDKPAATGKIVGANGKSHRIKLENSGKKLIPLLEPLQEWVAASSVDPPPIILNKNCATCPFRHPCQKQAEQEDNLSLLDRVTPKVVRKFERKGIFTVKQLSYLYKPRRRKKRAKKPTVTHKLELQALAIRTGKIYLQELPDFSRQPVELFLDIEGLPDQQAYYLIGLLVCEADSCVYHHFWADTLQDEAHIWQQFLNMVTQYPDAPIYHYGSYEPRAIAQLARWYESDGEALKNRLVNINTYIYGRVYFPVRSNSLKAIGEFIGASWTAEDASGLQSLVWRHHWDETQDAEYQRRLITYNEEDCRALMLLTNELTKITASADTLSEIDFADQPKRQATETGEEIHGQFGSILKFAHADYNKKRISFSPITKQNDKQYQREKDSEKKKAQKKRKRPRPTKIVHVPQREFCRRCENQKLQPSKRISKRLIIDLALTKNGIRKTIIQYVGVQGYCPKCHRYSIPLEMTMFYKTRLYGHGFKAWVVYYRVALRLSYGSIAEIASEQFNEETIGRSVPNFISDLACYYKPTEEIIIQNLLESPFIHADETPISIRGLQQYVWVFTDGKHVILKLTKTREADIVHEFLTNYTGILISDFYPGYDSVECRQQKCWVHLIRDLNDDLWTAPFDIEYETFVLEVRNLIIPIMEAVQKYGLKKRNLNKFKKNVEKFYSEVIVDRRYKSELAAKYQGRFIRYRESLFTFLEHDGIPWHNNPAETAIRHLAMQRKISGSFFEARTHDYLLLLGIRQTCRFQGKSFFKFLFSGEKDLDNFKTSKSRPVRTKQVF